MVSLTIKDKTMKKTYSSPVIRQIGIRLSVFIAGSAKGVYDSNSINKESEENLSRQNNWSFDNDDE